MFHSKILKTGILLLLIHQIGLAQKSDKIFMKINGENISLSEFENIYKKNNSVPTAEHKTIDEYIELFINYKLKVKEAEEMGLDTSKAFKNELAGYKKQLSQPYLIDTSVGESLIKEAHERIKYDVNASHILVRVGSEASPADTLKAYNRVMEYRKRLLKGEDFTKITEEAKKLNDKDLIIENLGYFTAFQMVYPFESAAYNTKPGQISNIVRTSFGYHVLKVADKRPSKGEIKVAHIMIKTGKADTPEQVKNAEVKANEIYQQLTAGEDFGKLAQMHSDDKSSASKGGELPMFGTGRMVPEFEEAAFALAKNGEFSKPIRTSYGWHIIKRLEKKEIGSYEEMKSDLKQRVQKDGRYSQSKSSLVNKLKAEYGVKPNLKNIDALLPLLDSNYFKGNFNTELAAKLDAKKTIFSIHDQKYSKKEETYTQTNFIEYLKKTAKKQNMPSDKKAYLQNALKKYQDETILKFEEDNLESKYPQYKMLSKEYRDGILLFDLMDKKVWSKAVNDTTGLKDFYEKNKPNYFFPERVKAEIYSCKDLAICNQTRKLVLEGEKTEGDILASINKDSQLNLKTEKNTYQKGDNEIVDKVQWKKGISEDVVLNNQYNFVVIQEILPPSQKSFNESRGLVTSEYQNYLESDWIKSLRNKYKVEVFRDVIAEIK